MKFRKKNFNDLPLYQKLSLIISSCIACIYIIFFFSIHLLTKNYEKTLYETNAALLTKVSSSIDASMEAIETLSFNIQTDAAVQAILADLLEPLDSHTTAVKKRELYNLLNNYTFFNEYVESVSLVFPDESTLCVGDSSDLEQFSIKTLSEQATLLNGQVIWQAGNVPGTLLGCVRQIRQMKYLALTDLASLYIIVDLDSMIQDALHASGYSEAYANFILYSEGRRIYPAEPYYDALSSTLIADADKSNYKILSVDGIKKFISKGHIPNANWDYLYFRNYESLFNQIQTTKFSVFSLTLLFCYSSLFLIRIAIKAILWHIDFLIQKIQTFGKGEVLPENPQRYEERKDEIGLLHQNFDEMTKSVKILRDENYDKQLLLKDTTIKMLQQQINPHFLYNTLDTINWLAFKYGADDISTIAASLGALFRSAVSNQQDLIPLSEELNILDNYIKIQQIRFQDRIRFSLNVPENLTDIHVPKLCLQPLVENAVKYSTEYSDDVCLIEVSIEELEYECLIKVANTGSKFEDELLKKLQNKEVIPHGSGIGLNNINSRLKLLYGNNYGLQLCNQNNMATVILVIPKNKEEFPYAKTSDC